MVINENNEIARRVQPSVEAVCFHFTPIKTAEVKEKEKKRKKKKWKKKKQKGKKKEKRKRKKVEIEEKELIEEINKEVQAVNCD